MILRFGKYEGHDLHDPAVPTSYIRGLVSPPNREEFEAELERRKQAAAGNTELINQIIARGFASLYQDARRGPGSDEERKAQMLLVEGAVAALNVMLRKYSDDYGPACAVRRRKQKYALELLKEKFVSDEDRDWALAELEKED